MKKILIIVTIFLISSCVKVEEKVNYKKAMLFYAASANNLQPNIWNNVQDIKTNYVANGEKDLYIFFKNDGAEGILYKIVRRSTGNELVQVKSYDKSLNSATTEFLAQVLSDLAALPEVTEITDIMFSSHGSSWIPTIVVGGALSKETPPSRSISLYSFGQDKVSSNVTMNIDEMAKVLEHYSFNSIIFDACNMASIEVFYQFRNCAKYILASPAEVVGAGMNYPAITPYFTQVITPEVLGKMAEECKKLQQTFPEEDKEKKRSSTFTVTDCSKLEEFGKVVKEITSKATPEDNKKATPSTMIRYDYVKGVGKDYKQYLTNLITNIGVAADQVKLDAIWAKTFPYYHHTEKIFGWDMTGSCGVAGYIYRTENIDARFNPFYLTLDWGKLIMEK
ncbi:MAG: clostripain-related cysteine peptidase [Rikenellaceae bacterium]